MKCYVFRDTLHLPTAQVLSFHKVLTRTPPLASSSRLSPPPRHLKDATPAPEMYTHVRPAPPPKKNLLPYPLKGWCTEQADRSSPLIPFYPSGFSNKCAPQAFNLWPLHLPAPQSCKKKKKLQKSPSSPDTCFPAMCFSPSFPLSLPLSRCRPMSFGACESQSVMTMRRVECCVKALYSFSALCEHCSWALSAPLSPRRPYSARGGEDGTL